MIQSWYNTCNKDKKRAATEPATEWLYSGSSQSSCHARNIRLSLSNYPPHPSTYHLTHSHIQTHTRTVVHVIQNSDLMNTPTTTFQVVFTTSSVDGKAAPALISALDATPTVPGPA